MKILVVEDDIEIAQLLQQFLKKNGYNVFIAHNTEQAREILGQENIALVTLDVMLPNEDGIDFLQNMRHLPPVILLSAKTSLNDKVLGLNAGADDYLTKPFEPEELLARINAKLRKNLDLGSFTINIQKLDFPKDLNLSSTEEILLKVLCQNIDQTVSRQDLVQSLGYVVSDRTVDVQITRLRKKLGQEGRIKTVRHLGYMLVSAL